MNKSQEAVCAYSKVALEVTVGDEKQACTRAHKCQNAKSVARRMTPFTA